MFPQQCLSLLVEGSIHQYNTQKGNINTHAKRKNN